jgi:hypothetical protein
MDAHSSRVKFTFGLIVVICLVAVFLAWRQKKQPDEVIPLSAPVRTVEEVGSDWRSDVTRIYLSIKGCSRSEQGFLALRM